ncbi:alpha-glucosidase-3 [Elsinoe australis]|uniref:alpha-glucosidase n=1 Tax=Elsinoe australis TaxID=40998 RepID=A0A4V6DTH2_9PEZI|nr:alpha-glucosidase-3 [Elsinoe australis]
MGPSIWTRATAFAVALVGAQNVLAQSTSNSAASDAVSASTLTTRTASVGTATVSGQVTTYSPQFTPNANIDQGATLLPNILDPEAVDAQAACPGYKASNVQRTAYGFNASLTLDGEPCYAYGTDIEQLVLTVDYQTANRLSVNIKPAYITAENQSWFEIPEGFVEQPVHGAPTNDSDSTDLQFSWTNEPTFSFTVLRQSSGEILFSTEGSKLVYEDQFIEFVTALPENYNLYGMGEHFHGLRLGNNFTATFFAADNGNPIDSNLYGSHPFYLDTRYYEVNADTGERTLLTGNASAGAQYESSSHGVYLRNAHPLEANLNTNNLTWRALGGSIDLYFFDGPTQPEVTKQYLETIGLPAMHQYWTLGFHQCRWGYKNWSMLEDVVTNFKNAEIPLETIWTDIDYMFQYRDFTNDQNTFPYPEGKEFLDHLHANGQHYIPIVDSAIYIPDPNNASDAYETYDQGHELDVFMKNPDGSEYIGIVWPGATVFPDWLAPNATQWWTEQVYSHHSNVDWDGQWIDMSEASSFCVGSCGTDLLNVNPIHPPFGLPGEVGQLQVEYPEQFNVTNATEAAYAMSVSSSQAAAASATASSSATSASAATTTSYLRTTVTPGVRQINHPPYVINNVLGDLAVHAVAPNATHYGGAQEYDIHNLFGHSILKATYEALISVIPGKRPFIIGRSTFAGSGKYAGHWGGDNNAKFYSMAFSIPQALSMSLFGIPMFGPDVCGFSGNTDKELCSRWMSLGAFFPFYRNHNVLAAISQEPYVWADVATSSRNAMSIRYALLPYMYTLLHRASTTGSTVLRALAWEFPSDPTLAAVDTQFLLGPAILVTPVLEPNVRTVRGVFPGVGAGEKWYDWYNGSAVTAGPGENVTLQAELTHINVFVRGGYVLPMQGAKLTTRESRASSWGLTVALDGEGKARGEVYVDDGVSVVQNETLLVEFTASAGRLYSSARGTWREGQALGNVTVLGVEGRPANVTLDGESVDYSFDEGCGKLSVTRLEEMTGEGAFSRDWTLSWA